MPLADTQDRQASERDAEHGLISVRDAHENGDNQREPSERHVKKMKRGKYISRACARGGTHADLVWPKISLAYHLAQDQGDIRLN
ncbi:hypothetical protein NX059_011882 [Plenodomus lindquistii]|nr:hypothetical protein NX059_011882 [Plenodomus lindquistii]